MLFTQERMIYVLEYEDPLEILQSLTPASTGCSGFGVFLHGIHLLYLENLLASGEDKSLLMHIKLLYQV